MYDSLSLSHCLYFAHVHIYIRDSLINVAFVSMALWSAVEADSVHRNMGHLL